MNKPSRILFLVLITLFFYTVFVFVYPYLYSGYYSKTTPPSNLKDFQILGKANCDCPLKIATIGDSTAIGQGTSSALESFSGQYISKYLLEKYSKISYSNYAVSGYKVKDVLENQIPLLEKNIPDLIFISIGANNVTDYKYSENDYKAEIASLISKITSFKTKIIWLSIPDFITSPVLLPPLNSFLSSRARSFNNITKNNINSQGVQLIDVFDSTRKLFQDEPNKYFSKDKYHPSIDGYSTWVEAIRSQIGVV